MKLGEFLEETKRLLDAGEVLKDSAIAVVEDGKASIGRLDAPIAFGRRARAVSGRFMRDAREGKPTGTIDAILGIGEMVLGDDDDEGIRE